MARTRITSTRGEHYVPSTPPTPTPTGRGRLIHPTMTTDRTRSWIFVCNNYTVADMEKLDNLNTQDKIDYLIYGKEIAETGTPHLQGYVVFKTKKTFNGCKDLLPFGCHIEKTCGTPEEAASYSRKEGDFKEFVNFS